MFDLIGSTATIVNSQFTGAFHNTVLSLMQLGLLALVAGANWALKMWLESMHSGWKRAIAERAVKYAEQKFLDNTEKQKQAAALISSHFPRISQDEVQHLLEEAVVNLKAQMEQPAPAVAIAAPTVTTTGGQPQ